MAKDVTMTTLSLSVWYTLKSKAEVLWLQLLKCCITSRLGIIKGSNNLKWWTSNKLQIFSLIEAYLNNNYTHTTFHKWQKHQFICKYSIPFRNKKKSKWRLNFTASSTYIQLAFYDLNKVFTSLMPFICKFLELNNC